MSYHISILMFNIFYCFTQIRFEQFEVTGVIAHITGPTSTYIFGI